MADLKIKAVVAESALRVAPVNEVFPCLAGDKTRFPDAFFKVKAFVWKSVEIMGAKNRAADMLAVVFPGNEFEVERVASASQ